MITQQKKKPENGTVLVIALFIVAIISGIAIHSTESFQISMKRGEQRLILGQVQQYLFGVEHFALWGLRQDKDDDVNQYGANANYDHLGEDWSQTSVEAPIGNGFARGNLEDAQSRFNLNQLATPLLKPDAEFKDKYTTAHKRFIRLLQTQENTSLGAAEAEEILHAVIDWVDADSQTTGIGGAENDYYLSLDPPYKAANQKMVTVSELRVIKGITRELYEYLAPLVVTLPDEKAGININTAKLEVLRSLNSPEIEVPLDPADAEVLMTGLPQLNSANALELSNDAGESYKQVSSFLSSDYVQSVFGSDATLLPPQEGLTTGSEYFLMEGEVSLGDIERTLFSLIRRVINEEGFVQASVIRRSIDPSL